MSKRRRIDRLAAAFAEAAAAHQPFVDPEVRRWAEEHGVLLAPDDELRQLHRKHHFHEPTEEELADWAGRLGVDLDD